MARDGEIPAIFNPKRVRAPSVVVTGDSPNGSFTGFPAINSPTYPQITHSDSLNSSHPDGAESVTGVQISTNIGICRTSTPTPTGDLPNATTTNTRSPRMKACKASCCSEFAQKIYFGICVTILVTASWVGATHCIKFLYKHIYTYPLPGGTKNTPTTNNGLLTNHNTLIHYNTTFNHIVTYTNNLNETNETYITTFNAPFFTSWFCTNFAVLFFPIYLLGRITIKKCESPCDILGDVIRGFRDRGFTAGRFINRCMTFCILWLFTTYLYILSVRTLIATDVMALFATNVASVYLLSWVILHEQFVGVRIVAVILCDTGIALLAYMDGITNSPTLAGVVLAALAAAGYAVFKVMFRKVMGDPPVGQIAFTFTTLGFLNAAIIWPVCVALYFTGTEIMPWDLEPFILLLIAGVLLLVFHMLTQFSNAVTYNMFVTLGLITAVPVSAAIDVIFNNAKFAGMKLSGIILIAVGFFLVMFPDNWPDYITRLLRNIILLGHNARWGRHPRNGIHGGLQRDVIDYRTGYIRSHLRSPSGRVR